MVVGKHSANLPIIDLAPIRKEGASEDDWQKLGEDLAAACRATGFAYIVNSGIDQALVDEWFDYSQKFFALPESEKEKAKKDDDPVDYRGWIAPEKEQASVLLPYTYNPEELKELGKVGSEKKESYSCMAKSGKPNIWPDENAIPGFRESCEKALETMGALRDDFLKILAYGIPGHPLEEIKALHSQNVIQFRRAHYLSVPWAEVEKRDAAWLSPHTVRRITPLSSDGPMLTIKDWSSFTFVFQHHISGLQVEDPKHRTHFLPVEPIPGAIVFNVGDFLERMTNDQFKSTVHRVVPVRSEDGMETGERYSITFFNAPNTDAVVDALPGTWDEIRPKKHEAVSMAEWGKEKKAKTM